MKVQSNELKEKKTCFVNQINKSEDKRPWWWLQLMPGDKIKAYFVDDSDREKFKIRRKGQYVGELKAIRKVYVNDFGSIWKVDNLGFENVKISHWKSVSQIIDFMILENNEMIPLEWIKRVTVMR